MRKSPDQDTTLQLYVDLANYTGIIAIKEVHVYTSLETRATTCNYVIRNINFVLVLYYQHKL